MYVLLNLSQKCMCVQGVCTDDDSEEEVEWVELRSWIN